MHGPVAPTSRTPEMLLLYSTPLDEFFALNGIIPRTVTFFPIRLKIQLLVSSCRG